MKLIKVRPLRGGAGKNWDFKCPDDAVERRLMALAKSGLAGKPERWVLHKDEIGTEPYFEEDVLETQNVVTDPGAPFQPEVPAVFQQGRQVRAAIPAKPARPLVTKKFVKLKAEYLIEIEDISGRHEAKNKTNRARRYLSATQWIMNREAELGIPAPNEIKAKRAEAYAVLGIATNNPPPPVEPSPVEPPPENPPETQPETQPDNGGAS